MLLAEPLVALAELQLVLRRRSFARIEVGRRVDMLDLPHQLAQLEMVLARRLLEERDDRRRRQLVAHLSPRRSELLRARAVREPARLVVVVAAVALGRPGAAECDVRRHDLNDVGLRDDRAGHVALARVRQRRLLGARDRLQAAPLARERLQARAVEACLLYTSDAADE